MHLIFWFNSNIWWWHCSFHELFWPYKSVSVDWVLFKSKIFESIFVIPLTKCWQIFNCSIDSLSHGLRYQKRTHLEYFTITAVICEKFNENFYEVYSEMRVNENKKKTWNNIERESTHTQKKNQINKHKNWQLKIQKDL